MKNYLTFDVEEPFHSHNFAETAWPEKWDSMPARVVPNTERILEMLANANCRATFFIVGWVADRYPDLIKAIDAAGHEIGAHSYFHRVVYEMSPDEFRSDVRRNVDAIAPRIGKPVLGFRAPSYTVTQRSLWALDILASEGFLYDSSVYPVRFHPRYGIPGSPRRPYRHANGLLEFPMPTARLYGQDIPIATGFYFRLMPYGVTRWCMRNLNQQGIPVAVNIHPWELDQHQPYFPATRSTRFRHCYGLKKTQQRLSRLLDDFEFQGIGEAARSTA